MPKIVYLPYYQVYQREGSRWFLLEKSQFFYYLSSTPVQLEQTERQFGLTEEKSVIELFRINGGKPGYYLADLRDKKYYYCGLKFEESKNTLQSLGIGRTDPMER